MNKRLLEMTPKEAEDINIPRRTFYRLEKTLKVGRT
jgi:hypothetical protein